MGRVREEKRRDEKRREEERRKKIQVCQKVGKRQVRSQLAR
jgi:hypothetical protein